jgi:hypothetical protein
LRSPVHPSSDSESESWASTPSLVSGADPLSDLARELDKEVEEVNQFATSRVQELPVVNAVLHLSLSVHGVQAPGLDAKRHWQLSGTWGTRDWQGPGIRGVPSALSGALKADFNLKLRTILNRVDAASETVVNLQGGTARSWRQCLVGAFKFRTPVDEPFLEPATADKAHFHAT